MKIKMEIFWGAFGGGVGWWRGGGGLEIGVWRWGELVFLGVGCDGIV